MIFKNSGFYQCQKVSGNYRVDLWNYRIIVSDISQLVQNTIFYLRFSLSLSVRVIHVFANSRIYPLPDFLNKFIVEQFFTIFIRLKTLTALRLKFQSRSEIHAFPIHNALT